jgi:hypothetical protein
MKKIINFIICRLKSHIVVQAGSCPYTNKNYNVCTRCGVMESA